MSRTPAINISSERKILPSDIDFNIRVGAWRNFDWPPFTGMFGECELECFIACIVRMCQKKGDRWTHVHYLDVGHYLVAGGLGFDHSMLKWYQDCTHWEWTQCATSGWCATLPDNPSSVKLTDACIDKLGKSAYSKVATF